MLTSSLTVALKPQYDTFYANQPKVKFDYCPKGFFKSNEMPLHFNVFGSQSAVGARDEGLSYDFETFG